MAGGIIHIDSAEAAIALTARPYDSENFLQQEIAKHDGLLGGDQFDPPKRWLLVSREMGVPAKEDGGSKWSLDHLFIDQHAIPTFVEVKRSSNKEIRRKIVGQMLDYAANANKYWSIKAIRDAFGKTCKQLGKDAEAQLLEFLNCEDTGEDEDDEVAEGSPEASFWNDVEANLQDGRLCLLFLADEIPTELQRIIEFLNEQMEKTEVLGVEVKKYQDEAGKLTTYVPRLIGQTISAQVKKNRKKKWDEESFFEKMKSERPKEEVVVARKLLEWARAHRELGEPEWGENESGSFKVKMDGVGRPLFVVGTKGFFAPRVTIVPNDSSNQNDVSKTELANRLEKSLGVEIEPKAKRPPINLSVLVGEQRLRAFCEIMEWVVAELAQN